MRRFLRRKWWLVLLLLLVLLFPRIALRILPTIVMFAVQLALNILMFGFMFFYLASRTRVECYLPGDLNLSWQDYRGHPEIVKKAQLWVELLKGPKKFEEMGGKHISGVLLEGRPGSGKTWLAKVVASEAGVPFLSIDCATLQGTFVGISPLRVIQVFRRARRLAEDYGACILFLDEIDSIGRSRTGVQPMSYWHWRRALSELVFGLRQPVPWDERDRKRIAYHEAGHALVTWLLQKEDFRITSCSIVRYGSALGHLSAVPLVQLFVHSVEEISKALSVHVAGRAAEEVVFGMPMGSMGGDMRAITDTLQWMVRQGMFGSLPLGESPEKDIKKQVEDYFQGILDSTKDLLRKHRKLLDNLAEELMKREEIIGEEVEKLLEEWSKDGETS